MYAKIMDFGGNPAMDRYDSAYDNKLIGQRISALMDAMGKIPADFARLTGLSEQAISNYKAGLNRISLNAAIEICRTTGATLDFIYFGDTACLPEHLAVPVRRYMSELRQN